MSHTSQVTIPAPAPRGRLRQFLSSVCLLASFCAAPVPSVHAAQTTNRLGITMVDIPAGSFVMGGCQPDKKSAFLGEESSCANPDPNASENETPQHRVSVSRFQMAKTEVTLGQFKAFIRAAGRSSLVDEDFIKYNSNGDNAAVTHVNWDDAQDFITWLNQTDGDGYRLPTEAEWEYACRAGANQTNCGSDSVGAVAWYEGNSGGSVHAVGSKQANAFGLHDMSGNVYEWVQDWYHDSYRGAPTNGSAWDSGGEQKYRVLRGGSWETKAIHSAPPSASASGTTTATTATSVSA